MNIVYPALFYYDSDADDYFIAFPDFPNSATQGQDLEEAMLMAAEYLGITIADFIESDETLPPASNINDLSLVDDNPFKYDKEFELKYDPKRSFISMISTNFTEYLGQDEPIKKTLTIPKWADSLGKEMNLNFSQTLTEAIASRIVNHE